MQNWLYIIQPYSISYSQSLMNKVLDSFLKSRAIGNLMVLYTLFCLTLHVFIWLNKCILRALLYSLERSFRHRGMTTGGVLGLASKVWKWPKSDHQRFMYAPVLYVVDWMKPLRRCIKKNVSNDSQMINHRHVNMLHIFILNKGAPKVLTRSQVCEWVRSFRICLSYMRIF